MPSDDLPIAAAQTERGDVAATIELLGQVPEEEIWLAGQRSGQTRRAYKADVAHFVL